MGITLAVVNQKGGVGKTTTAVNLAASMGLFRRKTLLIDADPQGNATSGLGVSKFNLKATLYSLLTGKTKIRESIIKTDFESLHIVPSDINLAVADIEMSNLPDREFRLKNALFEICSEYEYIIIDCPPSIGVITVNAMSASNSVLIPSQCEFYSLEGISQLVMIIDKIKKLYNQALEIDGILLTMYDVRLKLTIQVENEIKSHFKEKVFKTVIHRGVRLSEAPSFGKPAFYYSQNCKGTCDYLDLAEEIEAKHVIEI